MIKRLRSATVKSPLYRTFQSGRKQRIGSIITGKQGESPTVELQVSLRRT